MRPETRAILSGRRKDPSAVVARGLLWVASLAYGIAVRLRNLRYDRRPDSARRCGVPVLSVGNITTGGTGKTPIVRALARRFRDRDVRVAIVSRGYGRGEADVNDEAMELHQRLPDVPHVQAPDRVAAATIAVEELESQLVLMDDGFQHRRLHRDFDLVVIDASCPFGFGHLLPRGLLREPLASLRRAHVVVISRASLVAAAELDEIRQKISRAAPGVPCVLSDHLPSELFQHPGSLLPLDRIKGVPVFVFSAIGNPDAFVETVRRCGADVIDRRDLPDHDPLAPETVADLDRSIRSHGDSVEIVICTHKDLVKLRTDRIGGRPVAALLIDWVITEGEATLDSLLSERVHALCSTPDTPLS